MNEARLPVELDVKRTYARLNDTVREFPSDLCVHELFERQAAATPHTAALRFAGSELDYRSLDDQANQLAHHLIELGVGPDELVGLCLDRSFDLIVAALAVLKAGGAFVPIDPDYPKSRLSMMVDDARMRVLLTHDGLQDRFTPCAMPLVGLDSEADRHRIERRPTSRPVERASPDSLAYVIYTSGSTGTPKGVMVEHRALVNHMVWMQRRFPLAEGDRLLQKTSVSADASIWELFAAILSGATLVLAAPGVHRSPSDLNGTLAREDIHIVQVVPTMLDAMLLDGGLSSCTSLRRVYCGGEALAARIVDEFHEQSDAELVNLYGPSEATVDATYAVCRRERGTTSISIGRPIANTRAYVLDDDRELVAPGNPGELYLAGEGIARGYLRRPALTAERFVSDPFSSTPGARLYRTGDRVRVRQDGELEFLGRVDHQINVRGFRIEPGEVEACLERVGSIRRAVVVSREDRTGDPRLVAYIMAVGEDAPDEEALRNVAAEALPQHMRPSVYVVVDAFPMTPNGKIDRRALPKPRSQRARRPATPPSSPSQIAVARVWSELLDITEVDIDVHDDFFSLGGHSLLVAQLVARVGERAGVVVPLRAFFERPTVHGLAEALDRGSAASSRQPTNEAAIPPRPRELQVEAPLSFAQKRLWILERLTPGSNAYHIRMAWSVEGRLDIASLERSVSELVARHEIFRTSFRDDGGVARQIIAPSVAVPVEVVRSDHARRDRDDGERSAPALDAVEPTPFELERAPLLRVRVFRRGRGDHLLVVDTHHIVFDAWTARLFESELSSLYRANVTREQPRLPTPRLQYADVACWENGFWTKERFDETLAFWETALAGVAPLPLPMDHPRPAKPTHRSGQIDASIPSALLSSLSSVGRARGATLYMTLLAAFQTFLYRLTGHNDVAVGSPVAGRTHPAVADVMGLFVNTIVNRSDFVDDPSFVTLLDRTRQNVLGSLAHQDVPFDKVMHAVAGRRTRDQHPLFQVMFALYESSPTELALEGARVRPVPVAAPTAKFDLTLSLHPSERGLGAEWEFDADLLESATVSRMAAQFRTLLESIVEDAERPVSTLPLLDADERQRMLSLGIGDHDAQPVAESVHEVFEARAAETPEAIAIRFEDAVLDYGTLNARANRLAHHLIGRGVGEGSTVGVLMERSIDLIVALLAVLKAGAAYLPLDPDDPGARLATMIEDAAVALLVTREGLSDRLPDTSPVVCVDRDSEAINQCLAPNPERRARPESLAYVMYTSGSTGRPKGVMVPHRAVLRLVCRQDYVRLSPADTVGHVSNVSFDATTFEIWGALLTGARLAIVSREDVLDWSRLAAELERSEVSCLFLTTALFNRIALAAPETFRPLRTLLFGGETCDPEPVRALLSAGFSGRLVHVYGPTETTTFATWHEVGDVPADALRIPIGRPLRNTSAWILDPHGEPAPIGVVGMLYIGGDGVARGYWRQSSLTAERFVPRPEGLGGEGRAYRTGDLARFSSDGSIEFVRRADRQIKLRGHRIEPEEIERALVSEPGVRQASVLVRTEPGGERRLIAYVVPVAGTAPADAEWRRRLRRGLPDYMVPSAFVTIDSIPLTTNGKVDHDALLARKPASPARSLAPTPSRDEIEHTLCRIWEDALPCEDIGIDDDFFERGGHSLMAARVFALQDRELGRSLPISTLFEAPTVRSLAAIYRDGYEPKASSALVPIRSAGALPPIFAVPGVHGNVLCFADLALELGPAQPVFGLQSVGLDGARLPLETIEDIAAHYLRDVRRHQSRGPYTLVGACFGSTVAIEMARQIVHHGDTVAFLGLLDPSSLESGSSFVDDDGFSPGLSRGSALARFVRSRALSYVRQMREMGMAAKFQFIARKVREIGSAVPKRELSSSAHRELNQRSVYEANLKALLSYQSRPMPTTEVAVEIFATERLFDASTHQSEVDWERRLGTSVRYHQVTGRDSGDMLSTKHATGLAALLSGRLAAARNGERHSDRLAD